MAGFQVPGDIALTDDRDDAVLVDGASELQQAVTESFKLIKGTWRFDLSAGIPLLEYGFVSARGLPLLETLIQRHVQSFEGVREVTSNASLNRATRRAVVEWHAHTDVGQIGGAVDFEVV